MSKGQLIGGRWVTGLGEEIISHDPATGQAVWSGPAASAAQVTEALQAARQAQGPWADLPLQQRARLIESYARVVDEHKLPLAQAISRETGKPLWESLTEVQAMVAKAAISIEAYHRRCSVIEHPLTPGVTALTRFRPHGALAVFAPFNLPGHVPNGHIIPALLAGNTLVVKPSEQTPRVGELIAELWQEAGLPPGVFNLVQGARSTGEALANPSASDGLLFTGSLAVGRILSRRWAEYPGKILALELGGNNPLVVHEPADSLAAAAIALESAFITAGQRCTCASRLIVPSNSEKNERFLETLVQMAALAEVGPWDRMPEPFMGPVISERAAHRLVEYQENLLEAGGVSLLPMRRLDRALLTPGIIDVTSVPDLPDGEVFGPLLQVIRTPDFETAIDAANDTIYGLAAGLVCEDAELWRLFMNRIKAGALAWNRPTTGNTSYNAFGGIGASGNHRPAGYFSADYCAYPYAAVERPALSAPANLPPGLHRPATIRT